MVDMTIVPWMLMAFRMITGGGPSCTPWFGADVCLGTTEDVANLVFFGGQRALHLWVVKTWRQKNACKHMFIQGGAPPVINGL